MYWCPTYLWDRCRVHGRYKSEGVFHQFSQRGGASAEVDCDIDVICPAQCNVRSFATSTTILFWVVVLRTKGIFFAGAGLSAHAIVSYAAPSVFDVVCTTFVVAVVEASYIETALVFITGRWPFFFDYRANGMVNSGFVAEET